MTTDIQREAATLSSRFSAAGYSQIAIAKELQVSQSQISRLLSGTGRRRSKLFIRLCNYADLVAPRSNSQLQSVAEMHSALRDTWDGTAEHASALSKVIRSLGELNYRRGGR